MVKVIQDATMLVTHKFVKLKNGECKYKARFYPLLCLDCLDGLELGGV